MKVCVVHTWHYRRGGDSVAAWDLAQRLADAGHDVARLAMRHPDNDPSPWDVRWPNWVSPAQPVDRGHRVRSWASLVWNEDAARAARALYRDYRPAVVHAHHVHRHLTPSVLHAARRLGIPVVQTVHDYEWICPEGHLFSRGAPCEACRGHRYRAVILRRCKRDDVAASLGAALEKRIHRAMNAWSWVDRFIAPSRFLAGKLISFGVPADRVVTLPNPVAVPPATPPGQGWLYSGRLSAEKGMATLADALGGVPGTVLGEGSEAAMLARRMPGTRMPGRVAAGETATAIAASAVVVVPSLWWENQPYAVTEAQAAGRAVVASDVGGIRELIDDGRDGVLVPAGDVRGLRDAVTHLLADPARARALGAAARARVARELDPDRHLAAVESLYRALLRP